VTGVAHRETKSGSTDTGRLSRPGMVVWAAALAFVAVYGTLIVLNFQAFRIVAFDFGIFDQALWLISRGEDPFVTVRGLHLLADHSSYILFLLTPLYWIAPHQEVLLAFSVVVLAAGAPLTYAIARKFGATGWVAASIAVGYLLHPALAWSARDNFHPELLVIPLVLGGFLLLQHGRKAWALSLFGLALLAKEDVALLLVPLGLYLALVMKERMVGYVLAGLATLAFILNFSVLLPHFSPTGELLYSGRYHALGDGMTGVIAGLLTKPDVVVSTILEADRLEYLLAMVLPLPLALLEPRLLLIGGPTFLANALSAHSYQYEIRWHYTTYIVVAVALASANGGAWLARRWVDTARVAAVIGLLVAIGFHIALAPDPITSPEQWSQPWEMGDAMQRAVDMIPDGAVVSAMSPFVPHLTHREVAYLFPTPWARQDYGEGDVVLPSPDGVDWVVVITDRYLDAQPHIQTVRDSGQFEVVMEEGAVVVMRRRSP